MAIALLTETGMPNITPARIDLTGSRAAYAGHDYFQPLDLSVTDGAETEDLDLSGIATYHVYLKARPSDADADAIGSGLVTDVTGEATGEITMHVPRAILDAADAGQVWWSLSGTTTTGSYVVGIAWGLLDIRESALVEIA